MSFAQHSFCHVLYNCLAQFVFSCTLCCSTVHIEIVHVAIVSITERPYLVPTFGGFVGNILLHCGLSLECHHSLIDRNLSVQAVALRAIHTYWLQHWADLVKLVVPRFSVFLDLQVVIQVQTALQSLESAYRYALNDTRSTKKRVDGPVVFHRWKLVEFHYQVYSNEKHLFHRCIYPVVWCTWWMLLCVQICLVSQHLEESVANHEKEILQNTDNTWGGGCGPAWYGNGRGLNGAIGVAGVWDASFGSLVPLLLDCDASLVFLRVLSSSFCWSSFSLCASELVCVAAVVTWLHASLCWFSLPDQSAVTLHLHLLPIQQFLVGLADVSSASSSPQSWPSHPPHQTLASEQWLVLYSALFACSWMICFVPRSTICALLLLDIQQRTVHECDFLAETHGKEVTASLFWVTVWPAHMYGWYSEAPLSNGT